jgi:hypothetical protein
MSRLCTFAAALLFAPALAANGAGLPAFPGAEGFGALATGGRGGEVVHVTTLNDAGPGSFREAVSQPNRIVVFDVGGVIKITSPVSVKSNITIAGQTAPGGGITIAGDSVSFSNASNVIARYLRCRMGETGTSGKDAVAVANSTNMIFDHLSVSYGRDENLSVTGTSKDITIQDCLIGLGLQPHSCGGLIQADGVSILRTLYIHNHTRNAKIKQKNQYVNNVVYNWGAGAYIAGDSAGRSDATLLGSYFIKGPANGSNAITRANENFHIFAQGNLVDDNRNGTLDGRPLEKPDYGTITWTAEPADFPKLAKVMTAPEAYEYVLQHAGASRVRDTVDAQLIEDLKSLGKKGQTIRATAEFGGTGDIAAGEAPNDTDRDGMPDAWETARGLNPADPADGKKLDASGYSMVELYINGLVQ